MDRSVRVLFIGDEPDFGLEKTNNPEHENVQFTVETVTSAENGLAELATTDYDCVVADYNLPGQNGVELLTTIREDHPTLPFILYTAEDSEDVATDSIAAGATDYIQKSNQPSHAAILENRITNAVEQYRTQNAVERCERRLSAFLSQSTDPPHVLDKNGIYQFVTDGMRELFGHDPDELLGKSAFEYMHPDDRDRVRSLFKEVVENPNNSAQIEYRYRHKDGSWRWVESHATNQTDDPAIDGIIVTSKDITQRKEQKHEFEKGRPFSEQALDTLNDIFYVVSEDGELRRWNDNLVKVTGYSDTTIAEMSASDFFPEHEQERVSDALEETLRQGQATIEAELLTADGDCIPYELNNARLTDSAGNMIGLGGVGRDVTLRKEREQALERQNKRLEDFANIVAHDLRSPLQVAQGYFERAEQTGDEESFQKGKDALERIGTIIDDVLTLARQGQNVDKTSAIQLADVVHDAWQTVGTKQLRLTVGGDCEIDADPDRLRQLFENLIRNAVEHAGPTATVTVGPIEPMPTITRSTSDRRRGFYVADDGPGIAENRREKVLDSGFTTASDGTGFGLAIVEQIAQAHGWQTTVTESRDGGARFEFTERPADTRSGSK